MSGDLLASKQTNLLDSETTGGVGDEVLQDRGHQQGMFGQLSKSGEMGIEDHFASTLNIVAFLKLLVSLLQTKSK
jgi:hypothetical protein